MRALIDHHWYHGPHFQYENSIVFVTWRLAFTLPRHLRDLFDSLKELPYPERQASLEELNHYNAHAFKCFINYDRALGIYCNPGFSLNESHISKILRDAFHFMDGRRYELHAYCIMSNHVHLLIRSLRDEQGDYQYLCKIIQYLKSWTSRQINIQLNRKGSIWDNFYFDRMVRTVQAYENVVSYILNNPVDAGLVKEPAKWQDSYYHEGLRFDG